MKVAHSEQHVLGSGGLQETQAFKIRTSAHAFKILSSGLYSDKIAAVLREIGCNAHDAHVQAGRGHKPWELKLPNKIDNQFYIRDHGPGLSHDEVMNLYTTYFASTKQDSNDFTGAFGLGSKSPFSYTDSFTVTACHGGRKRIYSAHIGNKGAPEVALMSEGDLEPGWDTGIEVGFPVKPDDFADFGHKAANIFRFFSPLPEVKGGTPVKAVKIDQDFKTYAFVDKNDEQSREGIFVVMGNVRYPVNIQELRQESKVFNDDLFQVAREFKGLLLRFDIGDLQVAASREGLQYDPQTRHKISERLVVVAADVAKEIEKAFEKARTGTWKDMCTFKELKTDVSRGIRVSNALFEAAGVKNQPLLDACNSYHFKLPDLPPANAGLTIMYPDSRSSSFRMRVHRTGTITEKKYVDYKDNLLIIGGTAERGYARVRKAFSENTLAGVALLVQPKLDHKGTAADVDKIVNVLKKTFRGVPTHDVSVFPAPPLVKISKRKGAQNVLPDENVDLDGVPTKMSAVPDWRRVFVEASKRSNWGNTRIIWHMVDLKLDEHGQNRVCAYIDEITKHIPCFGVGKPVVLGKLDARRLRMRLRPEWRDFKTVVTERLAHKDNLDVLAKLTGSHKFIVDLTTWRSDTSTGLIENLAQLKHQYSVNYMSLAAVLAKHGVLDEMEQVYKNSSTASKARRSSSEPEVLTAYKDLASYLGILINAPKWTAACACADAKFSHASNVPWIMYKRMVEYAPQSLPKFIDEILTKGATKI